MPRRSVCLPRREASRSIASNVGPSSDINKTYNVPPAVHNISGKDSEDKANNSLRVLGDSREDASVRRWETQPSISGTINNTLDGRLNLYSSQSDQPGLAIDRKELQLGSHQAGGQKKVQFSVAHDNTTQGKCLSLLMLCH